MNSTAVVETERHQNEIQFTSFKAKSYSDYDSAALDFICMDKCMELEFRLMKKRGKMSARNENPQQLSLSFDS